MPPSACCTTLTRSTVTVTEESTVDSSFNQQSLKPSPRCSTSATTYSSPLYVGVSEAL